MHFEELDQQTREYMLREFDAEQASGNPYISKTLSSSGRLIFVEQMRQAIIEGDETSLIYNLSRPAYWNATEERSAKHGTSYAHVNWRQAAERLGLTEFNTWYVRGLSKRLLDEGEMQCQIYRAGIPKVYADLCSLLEGHIVPLSLIYSGHRAAYWPRRNSGAFSIPAGPNCHHTIRRLHKD